MGLSYSLHDVVYRQGALLHVSCSRQMRLAAVRILPRQSGKLYCYEANENAVHLHLLPYHVML